MPHANDKRAYQTTKVTTPQPWRALACRKQTASRLDDGEHLIFRYRIFRRHGQLSHGACHGRFDRYLHLHGFHDQDGLADRDRLPHRHRGADHTAVRQFIEGRPEGAETTDTPSSEVYG